MPTVDLASPYDGLTFMPDGTIAVDLDDGRRLLRRPKLGELRRLREARSKALEDVLAVGVEYERRAKEEFGDEKTVSSADRKAIDSKLTAEAVAEQERAAIGWLRFAFDGGAAPDGTVFKGLSDRPLPEDDDELPPWFANRQQVPATQMIEHWLLAPPPRGGGGWGGRRHGRSGPRQPASTCSRSTRRGRRLALSTSTSWRCGRRRPSSTRAPPARMTQPP